jgi:hypothetical protein
MMHTYRDHSFSVPNLLQTLSGRAFQPTENQNANEFIKGFLKIFLSVSGMVFP